MEVNLNMKRNYEKLFKTNNESNEKIPDAMDTNSQVDMRHNRKALCLN